MGNWRTVTIEGAIAPADLPAARNFVNTGQDWDRFHPLCNYGFSLCGLNAWVTGPHIHATGNLSERNYGVDAVAATLRDMVAAVPSLTLKVHCGGDYEDTTCIATITVADGAVTIGAPEVGTVGEGLGDVGAMRLMRALGGGTSG